MRFAFAALILCGSLNAQINTAVWYVRNGEGNITGGGEEQCEIPANVSAGSGSLTITAQAQSWPCGDISHGPTTLNYTSGFVLTNNLAFQYGTIVLVGTFPGGNASSQTGFWPGAWLSGTNCWVGKKLGRNTVVPPCNWHSYGSEEVDMIQDFGSNSEQAQTYYSQTVADGGCSHVSNINNSSHIYELDWSPGSLTWKIDGATTCTSSMGVPTSYMFFQIQFALGGISGNPSGQTFPAQVTVTSVTISANSNTVACDADMSCSPVSDGTTLLSDNFSSGSPAKDVFVSESGSGAYTGLSCTDSWPVINNVMNGWPNEPGYWSNGQIGMGTRIHFCNAASTYTTLPKVPSAGGSVAARFFSVLCGRCDPLGAHGKPRVGSDTCSLSDIAMLQSAIAGTSSTLGPWCGGVGEGVLIDGPASRN
jgi:hypothetical protein